MPTSRSGTRERKVTIRHDLIHDGSDYTPYEGMEVTGWPVMTMVRGRVVVRDGVLVGEKRRTLSQPREIAARAAARKRRHLISEGRASLSGAALLSDQSLATAVVVQQ